MDPTTKFILFAVISALGLVGGYTARRRGWMEPKHSRLIHLFTLVVLWSPVFGLAFWRLKIDLDLALIMLLQPAFMLIGWGVTLIVARIMKIAPKHRGELILCGALANQGITLGAYLCFVLLSPGDEAMGYAIAYVTSMVIFMVIIFYPVAHYYERLKRPIAEGEPDTFSLPRMMRESFLSLRGAPLFAGIIGSTLSVLDVDIPDVMNNDTLFSWLLYAGSFAAYFGNALNLRLGDASQLRRLHLALVLIKFMIVPAVFAAVLFGPMKLIGMSQLPIEVLMLSAFMPTAMNSVIISNLFHLDARMASSLWLTNTLLFFVIPLPVILIVL
jgi:predicted permease